MHTEYAMEPPSRVERIGAGRALVVVRCLGEETVGCAGAILAHVGQGDAVSVLAAESGTADVEGGGAPGAFGTGLPRLLGLPQGEILYSETLIERIQDRIQEIGAEFVYVCSPAEPAFAARQLSLAVTEAVRRCGHACRLVYFELETELRPNRLLEVGSFVDAIVSARDALDGTGDRARQLDLVRARENYRKRLADGADVEAYRLIDGEELRALRPGGPIAPLLSVLSGPEALERPLSPPLISIIVRTTGRPELADALNAIAVQTYPNLEVVVVQANAGAPLTLPERVGAAELRLARTGEALHRSRAANLGLSEARGTYLAFLDDDDWWLPEHLSLLARRLDGVPERAAYSGVRCVRPEGDGWEESHLFNDPFDANRLLVDNFVPIHSVLFHRSLFEEGCRFDEDLDVYEDWDFWVQVCRLTPMLHEPSLSAVYRLAAGTGFGVSAAQAEVESGLARFFAKWRHQWTDDEWMRVVERARSAQGIAVMQRQVRLTEGQRDQLGDYNRTLNARLAESNDRLGRLHERKQALEAQLLTAETRVRDEMQAHFAERQCHYEQRIGEVSIERDLLRQRLDELHASTSWRLTVPVRMLRRGIGATRCWMGAAYRSGSRLARLLYRGVLPLAVRRHLTPALSQVVSRPPAVSEETPRVPPFESGVPFNASPLSILRLSPKRLMFSAETLVLPTSESPKVSVVMPVFKQPAYTLECLSSIVQYPPLAAFELILIDDGSDSETRALLRAVRGIRLIENESNLGFLRSCNKAAMTARGRYLLFLNNDTQVRPGWLDRLLELFADSSIGMTGSKLLYPSGHLQEAGVSMKSDGSARLVGLNGDPSAPEFNQPREVDYCSGASFMIERDLFERVGGFDDRYAPAYFEDADLAFQVRALGRRILYQPASEVVHHLSVTTGVAGDKLARIESNRLKFVDKWRDQLSELDRVRLIAFYLPQFHPIPENDDWWGRGFTEWTNVTRARPNFAGHYQPHLPGELGFYDLRLAETRRRQAELAREHGIHGFCYYYYWFNGRRLLHRPLDEVLASGEPDFPFCVCWANENWSRRWDGREQDLLMEQQYSPEDDVAFIRALFPALSDPRYIRIDGRPLLLVYRASLLPDPRATTDRWREECVRAGLPEPYLACVNSFREGEGSPVGFEAAVEFPPHGRSVQVDAPEGMLNPNFSGRFYDYAATARTFAELSYPQSKVFRGVMPGWDNTARRQDAGDIFLGASPEIYESWLTRAIAETRDLKFGDERLVFVNAWNEWAEGNHLEPDSQFGNAYLEATRRALDAVVAPSPRG
ncbi:glycoside hydrolase family 99-like domain-containing protein [Thiorhodococcus fuscus]|uniref:Glycoside hydrolase family 99-like domain-containing protein n=1 Tax=Thiorhodococcus fuscus TaxID=527200 RepID=A0ABW4YE83_9GAMM